MEGGWKAQLRNALPFTLASCDGQRNYRPVVYCSLSQLLASPISVSTKVEPEYS